jgi:arabinose-5-phosphate isomerase
MIIEEARKVLAIEARAITELAERIDDKFVKAVEVLFATKGKVICSGVGKSGIVARKMAATFSSTGTPALFLHPTEGSHGDLGIFGNDDVLLAISYGGESDELNHLLHFCKRRNIPVVGVTGKITSTLGRQSTVALDASIREEACPLGLAPTASSITAQALGDALAMTLIVKRGFSIEDFAEFHPGGQLGRKLLTRVSDVMHSSEAVPLVKQTTTFLDVLTIMSSKEVQGVAVVIDDDESVLGIITDGDLRRRLKKGTDIQTSLAKDLMSRQPKTIDKEELAQRALFLMEQFRIQSLLVVDKSSKQPNRPVGLLHIQDLIKARIG